MTDLQVDDKTMGGISGKFSPTAFYFDSVRKDVWKFWQTNKPDYATWHTLRLNVQLENGMFLLPRGGFVIDDIRELPDEPKRIDLVGVDNDILSDFLSTIPPRPFVEEPWSGLSIDQKIAFEDELRKELRSDILLDFQNPEFSAFCHDQRNDEVLFEINRCSSEMRFVLVHLTWTGKTENNLSMTYYSKFDDFKYSRMYADKAEWED